MTKPRILLDSGAYSAFHRGDVIELDPYIRFVKRHSHLIESAVNLDIIPERGFDKDQLRAVCERSYRNLQTMKDAGLNPIPVVHQVDGPGWLERYLDDREPYIALAPVKGGGQRALNWLNRCFETIKQASYQPQLHGLAVTNAIQMMEFPWTSVNSSTWVRQAAAGNVFVPVFGLDDRPDYRHKPNRYRVTDRMRVERNHIDRLEDLDLDDLRQFLDGCGLALTEVRYSHVARWRALIIYFKGLEEASGVNLYFVGINDAQSRNVLMERGADKHLLSYFQLRQCRDDALERYVEGVFNRPKPKRRIQQDWNSDAYRCRRALAAFYRLRTQEEAILKSRR